MMSWKEIQVQVSNNTWVLAMGGGGGVLMLILYFCWKILQFSFKKTFILWIGDLGIKLQSLICLSNNIQVGGMDQIQHM